MSGPSLVLCPRCHAWVTRVLRSEIVHVEICVRCCMSVAIEDELGISLQPDLWPIDVAPLWDMAVREEEELEEQSGGDW